MICASCGELILDLSPAIFLPIFPSKEGVSDRIRRSGNLLTVLSSPKSIRTEVYPQSILDKSLPAEEKLEAYGSLLKEMGISDRFSLKGQPFPSSEEREILSQILLLNPKKVKKSAEDILIKIGNLHFLLAKGLEGLGEWAISIRNEHLEIAKKAYSRLKSSPVAKRNLGFVYLECGEDEKAMENTDAALKELRKDAELWAAKGVLLHRSEKPTESLKCFDRALKLDENDSSIWTDRGKVLADLSRLEDALDSFDEAIVRNKIFIPAWNEKMDVLLRLGKKEEAKHVSERIQEMVSVQEDYQPVVEQPKVEPPEPIEAEETEPPEPIEALKAEPVAVEPMMDEEGDREEIIDFLLQIEGIGRSKAKTICNHGIDSIEGLKEASVEDLTRVKGISKKIAKNIRSKIQSEPVDVEPLRDLQEEGVEETMETARAYLEEGDYENALACYDILVGKDPGNDEAWFNKGEVLQALGRPKEAVEAYDRVISIDEKNTGAWMEKANTLLETGKPLDAVECYKRVLDMDSENTDFLVERAKVLASDENQEAAILCYDIILEKYPDNFEAHISMVLSLLDLGDHERAEKYLEAAEKLNSMDEKVWWARGHIMDMRGRWGASIQFYNRAISLKWNYPEPWIGKGEILLRQENFEEAKKCFEKVLQMDPRNEDAWLGKAKALEGMNQEAQALEWLDEFLKMYPENEKAREIRSRLKPKNPGKFQSLLHQTKIYKESGDFEKAAHAIMKVIMKDPEKEDAWTLLGDVLLDAADPRGTFKKVEMQLSDITHNTNAMTSKGAILLRIGEHAEALDCFDMALSKDENHKKAKKLKERCLEEMKKVR
jgi:tetratricopeptide (TPR) repeat protein